MAHVRDLPRAIRGIGPWAFMKRMGTEISEDSLMALGAAMAYAWLFAIFPFIIFLISLVPYLPERLRRNAEHDLAVGLYSWLQKDAADAIWVNVYPALQAILYGSKGTMLSIGAIVALWAASGGMSMTMAALDKSYDVELFRPYYIQKPLAIMLTILVASLILSVVVILPVGTVATNWFIDHYATTFSVPLLVVWQVLRYALGLFLMLLALALVYYWGANHEQKFRFITPGSLFCVAIWLALGYVFRMYIDRFSDYGRTYGAVGGVAILLLFFYVDSLVLLIGAEINALVDRVLRDLSEQQGTSAPEPA
jgi:membrane protein